MQERANLVGIVANLFLQRLPIEVLCCFMSLVLLDPLDYDPVPSGLLSGKEGVDELVMPE